MPLTGYRRRDVTMREATAADVAGHGLFGDMVDGCATPRATTLATQK